MSGSTCRRWRSAFVSHTGCVRPRNEDSFLDAPDRGLWVVADGMGGHEAGQIASRMIIEALEDLSATSGAALADDVRARLLAANGALIALSQAEYGGRPIGSTVAALVASGGEVVCLWAGDSRIYRLRAGQLQQLTRDHSPVEQLVAMGVIDRAQAAAHYLANVVTRSVGSEPDLALDERREAIEPGDRYLLCSDGLTRVVKDTEIARSLAAEDDAAVAAQLLQASLDRGAPDNVTVGVVMVGG